MFKTQRKQTWQERAVSTREYHVSMLKANPKWRVKDTAEALNRSDGGISEDITLAQYLKVYPKMEHMRTVSQALFFIREKKRAFEIEL